MSGTKKTKFYTLNPKMHGVGGLTFTRPDARKQDRRAKPIEAYAVIFFPKIKGIGRAQVGFFGLGRSLSQTPEAAVAKFMDDIRLGEKWGSYAKAGHRVRKVKIIDLGDATEPAE